MLGQRTCMPSSAPTFTFDKHEGESCINVEKERMHYDLGALTQKDPSPKLRRFIEYIKSLQLGVALTESSDFGWGGQLNVFQNQLKSFQSLSKSYEICLN